jgi:hypothetical protein
MNIKQVKTRKVATPTPTTQRILIEYVRGKPNKIPHSVKKGKVIYRKCKGDPVGVLVADVSKGVIRFGWSGVDTTKYDFDKAEGIRLAKRRIKKTEGEIQKGNASFQSLPRSVYKNIPGFMERAKEHFPEARSMWSFEAEKRYPLD